MNGKTIMVCGIGASFGMALWLLFGGAELFGIALAVLPGVIVILPFTKFDKFFPQQFFV